MADEQLQYPIGRFTYPNPVTSEHLQAWIEDIVLLPAKLADAIDGLCDSQLETQYRPGGWTVRQVVHHLADSHMNSFIRFKLALTEEQPVIKPYDEGAWSQLEDVMGIQPSVSLTLISALHERWVRLLRSMTAEQFEREFVHPESGRIPLARATGLYAWHGLHHTAHITALRKRNGW